MTVPAHNLYDFIHQVTEKRFWLLYFFPWGQKDLKNVTNYQLDYEQIKGPNGLVDIVGEKFFDHRTEEISKESLVRNFQPVLFCHDQEPLNFDLYRDGQPLMEQTHHYNNENYDFPVPDYNLRNVIVWSWQKRWILLHSERNSLELEKYENTGRFTGAYWWSHGVIARDWYRFAEHDQNLGAKNITKLFLIYCRDITGTRAYRQKILEQFRNHPGCHFGNPTAIDSTASAYYHSHDFSTTAISLVLETLFADDRIHLTEKILRPIACGHPFVLAAGPGSLSLLRSYGFETFHPYIDESYDLESRHDERLKLICKEVDRLLNLPLAQQNYVILQCRSIAQKNKLRFFSAGFLDQIQQELYTNVMAAHQINNNLLDPSHWWHVRKWRKNKNPDGARPTKEKIQFVRYLRKHQGSFEQYQSHEHRLDDKSGTHSDDV